MDSRTIACSPRLKLAVGRPDHAEDSMRPTSSLPLLLLAALTLVATVACDDGGDKDEPKDTIADTSLLDADTSRPDTTADTTPDVVEPADPLYSQPVRVTLVYRDLLSTDAASMYVIGDVANSTNLRLNDLTPLTTGIDCRAGLCSVTEDLGWLIYQTGAGELHAAEIGSDLSVSAADLQRVASNVSRFVVAGTRLGYESGNAIFYDDLADGLHQPRQLAEVIVQRDDDVNYTGGGFALSAHGDALVVYRYDLSSLATFRVPLDGSQEQLLFRYGIPRGAGSAFGGNNPLAVSHDGSQAVALISGLMLYDTCASNQDCREVEGALCYYYTDESGVQSTTGVCGASQITLESFPLDGGDLLEACTSDEDCDSGRCAIDPTALITNAGKRFCAPRRHVVSNRNLCAGVSPGRFAEVHNKLLMTPDDRVVFLGINNCGGLNEIPDNYLMAIDADLDPDSITTLQRAFDADSAALAPCYDEGEQRWNYDACPLNLQDFDFGPDGGLIVLASGATETAGRELWSFDGAGHRVPLTSDVFNDVTGFFVVAP